MLPSSCSYVDSFAHFANAPLSFNVSKMMEEIEAPEKRVTNIQPLCMVSFTSRTLLTSMSSKPWCSLTLLISIGQGIHDVKLQQADLQLYICSTNIMLMFTRTPFGITTIGLFLSGLLLELACIAAVRTPL
jgi:hypothetical protein